LVIRSTANDSAQQGRRNAPARAAATLRVIIEASEDRSYKFPRGEVFLAIFILRSRAWRAGSPGEVTSRKVRRSQNRYRELLMRRLTTVYALVLASAIALPAMSNAQANASDNERGIVTDTDRGNHEGKWGLFGLLGLAGLLGLRRRDRKIDREGDLGPGRPRQATGAQFKSAVD
jgi:MYXO-CTERM domain-containing protein